MRRNGYLWPFGVKLDTAVRFADPVFLLECKISATWQRFPLIFLHFTCWFSAIFLLPVCLTYWPKKYTTRVDPYVDNSHQVWSWYDRHCRVIAFLSADTSRDLDLWPFDLEQLSYMAGHVTNLATKFEDPMTIRSWVTSYNGFRWLQLKMRRRPLRMRRITWPVSRGSKTITFLESPTPICLFTIQLRLSKIWLTPLNCPIVKISYCVHASGPYLLHKLSYTKFGFENRNFSLPWQQGSVWVKFD